VCLLLSLVRSPNNLRGGVAARLALEHALVVIWLVVLNTREPHRRAAFGTFRVFDFLELLDVGVLHRGSPAYRRERSSVSQSPTPTDRALAGDAITLVLRVSALCPLDDLARK